MNQVLLVGLGGGFGAIMRYFVVIGFAKIINHPFPIATFVINLLGCFLIGLFAGWIEIKGLTPNVKLLLITGFCGGFTTFSAFSFENLQLLEAGDFLYAGIYTALSVVLGVLLTFLGLYLGNRFI